MNLQPVDRQGPNIMDSESADRGAEFGAVLESSFHEKERLHENVEGCSRWTFTFKYSERTRARARGEGSKSHPRGKQWLTVYRAHQV